jgi:hypothetical protein
MSNELSVILKNASVALTETGLDEDTLAVAGNGASAMKRLSIKGGVFRKFVGGKEVGAIDERHMNVVIVKMAHDPYRMYYGQAYKEGEKVSPLCWSSNNKIPDADVENPVAKACELCPNSVKGSAQGGTGAACRLHWRTAVVLPNDPGGDVMQLVLPATSAFGKEESGKWPFRPYVQMLANHNVSASRVVTRIQFDTKSPVPKLLFSPVSEVPVEDLPTVKEQSQSTSALNAIKLSVFKPDKKKPLEFDVAPPAAPTAVSEPEAHIEEPVLRKTDKAEAAVEAPPEVASVLQKWAKKKE